jgi:hypothetical protein
MLVDEVRTRLVTCSVAAITRFVTANGLEQQVRKDCTTPAEVLARRSSVVRTTIVRRVDGTPCGSRSPAEARGCDPARMQHGTVGVSIDSCPAAGRDTELVTRLRAGDADAFRQIVSAWSPVMLHVAGRQGVQESRMVPSSRFHEEDVGPTVDPGRFRPSGEQRAGVWRADCAPGTWGPEAAAVSAEPEDLLGTALADLPPRQWVVVELRDRDGLSADEVCNLLDFSPSNQRVLLHRARAKLPQPA